MSFLILSGQRAWRNAAAGAEALEINSPFIQDYLERRERQRELRSWTTNTDGDHMTAYSRGMTWGNRSRPIAEVEVHYQDAAPDGRGGFYYAVGFGVVGGLFHQNAAGEERRLFHRDRFVCDGLSYQKNENRFVAALGGDGGTTHLVLLDENGRQIHRLTEGDCVDARPSWDPVNPDTVLYQTCGMARGANGWLEHSPWEAAELDLARGEVATLWRVDGMDVLLPRRDAKGALYALIRPSGDAPIPFREYARRVVMMPWIFAQAVFGFTSAFTSIFARKPLWKAGGPVEKVDAAPAIQLLGRRLETSVLQNRNGKKAGDRATLVPDTWQLWRRDPDGGERKLATNVSWYALGEDGTPYYSTGLAIHALRENNEETVYEGPLVESFLPL